MVLPPKVITIEANFLDATEHDFYQGIYTQSQAQFGAYVDAGTLLNRPDLRNWTQGATVGTML